MGQQVVESRPRETAALTPAIEPLPQSPHGLIEELPQSIAVAGNPSREEASHLRLPRLHSYLQVESARALHDPTPDDAEAAPAQPESSQGEVAAHTWQTAGVIPHNDRGPAVPHYHRYYGFVSCSVALPRHLWFPSNDNKN